MCPGAPVLPASGSSDSMDGTSKASSTGSKQMQRMRRKRTMTTTSASTSSTSNSTSTSTKVSVKRVLKILRLTIGLCAFVLMFLSHLHTTTSNGNNQLSFLRKQNWSVKHQQSQKGNQEKDENDHQILLQKQNMLIQKDAQQNPQYTQDLLNQQLGLDQIYADNQDIQMDIQMDHLHLPIQEQDGQDGDEDEFPLSDSDSSSHLQHRLLGQSHLQLQSIPLPLPLNNPHTQQINPHNNLQRQLQLQTTTTGKRQKLSIPFWDQQRLFKSRNSWKLMVAILAQDCMPKYSQPNNKNATAPIKFPTLLTLQDALENTNHATHVILYLPQSPNSTLFPNLSVSMQYNHKHCQAKLLAMIHTQFQTHIENQQLQLVHGIVNPLPARIAYDYTHKLPNAFQQLEQMKLPQEQVALSQEKIKKRLSIGQLMLEQQYSLGLDFAYIAELAYRQHDDLLFFLTAGTRLTPDIRKQQSQTPQQRALDYGLALIQQYENFQQRLSHDLLVHRFCYMSFLQEDTWFELPPPNATSDQIPPRYQDKLQLPTGILMERHGLYRMSMILRSLLPYHKHSTAGLVQKYCNDLLWQAQILQPVGAAQLNLTTLEEATFPPVLWIDQDDTSVQPELPQYKNALQQEQLRQFEAYVAATASWTIPEWVTVDNRQIGPQRAEAVLPADLIQLPNQPQAAPPQQPKRKITFLVPTSTRPNGIKNLYVTQSLNQLFPLIRRDLRDPDTGKLQAAVLLVICGNTQDELDDHQDGLWEYYGPEIKEGILEIVSTNLETYPSLHDLPNNYNDNEARLRWRSKQNLDISSSFFAAKGRSEYIMLLEDDTGYRDKFTPTLKAMMQADQRQEAVYVPDPKVTGITVPPEQDYWQHTFAQVHFGFGYSGVLIHDDDALVYAVVHYVLMDEKPCDLMFLANHLQGQVLDQKWRWQMKRVLLTHLGSVSSLKGKFQPVWGKMG
ncbi:Alpha-1,3-mannosyl-glycoprotein 4-beta-N-acetylglucosaminyltransferase C [Seminavis robusta]|uniref:Alpha-1,3-mannosyl-glycoprotein 4-beta-N-acetylglucosaminyltransferase C n=1 Tax=Seminavis robusta TaxID=568900 RepID=A0A9N8D563_9STRA|nr:Alpha-1,3-mannosyl-glycoprotein 4-beta-N-acetylglucosaminyltransferase C [Seminavis robusta]|eukprot:Sro7_g005780.1 Alpha-1,3-mannosyl-glycoprotein 4-beta-N-acetylglucosaminyltransferase C (953) ;mRNA; f:30185-33043